MPRCKYCHEMLSNIDKDICPFCGGLKPLEGVSTETMNITDIFDPVNPQVDDYDRKSSKKLIIYSFAFGFIGMPFFYLKKNKIGFIYLGMTLSLYILVSLLLFFLISSLHNPLSFLIALIIPILVNVVLGIYSKKNRSFIKDAYGETLS